MPKCVSDLLVLNTFLMHLNNTQTSSCGNMRRGKSVFSIYTIIPPGFCLIFFFPISASSSKGIWDSAKFCFHVFSSGLTPTNQLASFNVHNFNHFFLTSFSFRIFIQLYILSRNTWICLVSDMWAPSNWIHPVLEHDRHAVTQSRCQKCQY